MLKLTYCSACICVIIGGQTCLTKRSKYSIGSAGFCQPLLFAKMAYCKHSQPDSFAVGKSETASALESVAKSMPKVEYFALPKIEFIKLHIVLFNSAAVFDEFGHACVRTGQ